jgi:3-deoxy-D-manno-octulosonate 8-phosphate phosphatase (KDO 8-P phosphatase)
MTVTERAARVKLMLVDIDGVLTDGRIYFVPTASGEWDETKGFNALDGIAFQWFHQLGIQMGLISGRKSTATRLRAETGHFRYCYMGNHEKIATLEEILAACGFAREEVAYMGDDLTDIVCFHRVGFAIAVANARPEVKAESHYVTQTRGGDGAFREAAELILKAQGKWDGILKKYEVQNA